MRWALLALTLFFLTPTLEALPNQVIIIRHAEKPSQGYELSQKGLERADALVPYFLSTASLLDYGPPVAIYASQPTEDGHSIRSLMTITPLAQALNQSPIALYGSEDIGPMADEIMANPDYEGKMVLICWEHDNIPDLAKKLGAKAPSTWPDGAYDVDWVITYLVDGSITFQQLYQELLYGDSKN
jgi:hypothetical protein